MTIVPMHKSTDESALCPSCSCTALFVSKCRSHQSGIEGGSWLHSRCPANETNILCTFKFEKYHCIRNATNAPRQAGSEGANPLTNLGGAPTAIDPHVP